MSVVGYCKMISNKSWKCRCVQVSMTCFKSPYDIFERTQRTICTSLFHQAVFDRTRATSPPCDSSILLPVLGVRKWPSLPRLPGFAASEHIFVGNTTASNCKFRPIAVLHVRTAATSTGDFRRLSLDEKMEVLSLRVSYVCYG